MRRRNPQLGLVELWHRLKQRGYILISEVLEAVEQYEPRAQIGDVTFELGERPGALIPVVEVNIIDDE